MCQSFPKLLVVVPVVALCIVLGMAQATDAANLLRNGSFETVPGNNHNQGLLPSDWVQYSGPSPGADTYDASGVYGLWPSDFGHFTGVTAKDGIRWVAAWSGQGGEVFAQLLTAPLTAGTQYTLSAYLRPAYDYPYLGTYEISLGSATDSLVLGQLSPAVSSTASWQESILTFTAPQGSDTHPYLVFGPHLLANSDVYIGIDAVSLTGPATPVPLPPALLLLGPGLAGLAVLRKRIGN